MNVTLTKEEMRTAALIGVERQIASLLAHRSNRHGAQPDSEWSLHIEGAAGEMAAAKCLDRYWGGTVDAFRMPDLGNKIQVRTRRKMSYDLIVRKNDSDGDLFVLVLGIMPTFVVTGFIFGHEAKQERWLQDHGGRSEAYFVPKGYLHPIKYLKRELDRVTA